MRPQVGQEVAQDVDSGSDTSGSDSDSESGGDGNSGDGSGSDPEVAVALGVAPPPDQCMSVQKIRQMLEQVASRQKLEEGWKYLEKIAIARDTVKQLGKYITKQDLCDAADTFFPLRSHVARLRAEG